MKSRRFASLLRAAWKATGFALVLTALSASAHAGATPAPEIDPGSILSALTLLGGGLMVLTDRCRAK